VSSHCSVSTKVNSASDWILVQPSRGRPRFRLFCFPHAGAGATTFHGWSSALPDGVEVRALRLPGRETRLREALLTSMDVLVETLLRVLDPEWSGSYGFFGHSMGARVAFELTRALVRTGRPPPRQLWISGGRAPHLPPRRSPIHGLPDAELVATLCRLYDAPKEVFENRELAQICLPIVRADLALLDVHEHRPGPPLPVPVSVFGGIDDPIVLRAELEAWSEHTNATFQVHTFPGRHLYLKAEARTLLLAQLSQDLASWLP
jgi:medium-chain acyl-[acyl-carrier-protein] hydrolase